MTYKPEPVRDNKPLIDVVPELYETFVKVVCKAVILVEDDEDEEDKVVICVWTFEVNPLRYDRTTGEIVVELTYKPDPDKLNNPLI